MREHRSKVLVGLAVLLVVACGGVVNAQVPASEGAPDSSLTRDEYLKVTAEGWQRVQRVQDGFRVLGDAAPPAVDPLAASGVALDTGGLFHPYVALPTGSWPEAVAIGDINGDGLNDVVMVTSSYFDPANDNTLHVWTQNPDGTLAPRVKYFLGGRPQSVAIGDVNGDGLNDVVVAINTGIGVLTQKADGTLNPMVLYPTNDAYKVRVADLNNDGLLDIVSVGWNTNTVTVFTQNQDGTLAPPVTYAAPHAGWEDLKVGDVNNDGLTDVIVMNGQGFGPNVEVLYQQPDGTLGGLTSLSVGSNHLTSGVGVGDVNGDGLNDIVTSYGGNRPDASIGEFLQNAGGGFDPPVRLVSYDIPEPVEVVDVNGDGLSDIVTAHGGWLALGVYLQQPDGTLATEQLYPLPYASHYNSHGLAVGDINSDGSNDVVIADYNNGLIILYGTGAPGQPSPSRK